MTDEMRDQIALTLRACGLRSRSGEVAEALLPTVRKIATEAYKAGYADADSGFDPAPPGLDES